MAHTKRVSIVFPFIANDLKQRVTSRASCERLMSQAHLAMQQAATLLHVL